MTTKTILFMLFTGALFAQLPPERFTASIFLDPNASIKEEGLNFGFRAGYEGVIYAKLQYESFSVLQGGFDSFGAVIGGNLEKGRAYGYAGVRLLPLVIRDGASNPNFGIESGMRFELVDGVSIGLRGTFDYREDKDILDTGTADWEFSTYGELVFVLESLSKK